MYSHRLAESTRLMTVAVLLLSWLVFPPPPSVEGWEGGDPEQRAVATCQRERSMGPDLIVADLAVVKRWDRTDSITAYSVETTVCNFGDEAAAWVLNTNEHPVVAQHIYRLKDGRLEQIGLSWVAHTFLALNEDFCSDDCEGAPGPELSPLCSDSHSTGINGLQSNLGPRWQVNAATGEFPYPWVALYVPGPIARRLQVHDVDLHPPDNPGALYFVEGHYVTADEAAAGNGEDNASYRRVQVLWFTGNPTVYDLAMVTGHDTQVEQPAILAWHDVDPAVTIRHVDIPGDGRMTLAYKVTDLGGGEYHYEYALYNMNSHRSAGSFSIPIPDGVTVSTNDFHDVDYHSGNPYDRTDWTAVLAGNSLTWETIPEATNPDANALRWGTTYNFRFDADRPPGITDVTVGLFRAGTPGSVTLPTLGPAPLDWIDCNSNGVEDVLDIFVGTSTDCNDNGIPDDCDIAAGTSVDCTSNGIPDECEPDCNTNGVPDSCDILVGTSVDCTGNGIPDECEPDCNTNGVADSCDIFVGTSVDCTGNDIPDECEPDCNTNGVADSCDILIGTCEDCNSNAIPDVCDLAAGTCEDCNTNAVPDVCDIALGTSEDCNSNGVPDECQSPITEAWVNQAWIGTPACSQVVFPGDLDPHYIGHDAFVSIQEGIDAVGASTVHVAPGTYDEPLNIEGRDGLTIVGTDRDTVILQSSSTLGWNVGGYGESRRAMVRVVSSTDVVLQNLTLDFDQVKANLVYGVLYWDSTGTLDDNVLENMSVDDAGGGYDEITSYFRAPSYTDLDRAQITVSSNGFSDTGRVGVCTHEYVHATITGNTFAKTTEDFGYAVQIGSASTATINGNTIQDYDTPVSSNGNASAGIYVENSLTGALSGITKTVSLSQNEVYRCQWALYVGNEPDGLAGDVDIVLTASENHFQDNVDGAVLLTDEDKVSGSSVNATFGHNTLVDNGGAGYFIYTWGDGDVTATLTDEIITGHNVGIYLNDYAGGTSTSSYNVTVSQSNIYGNTEYGVQNEYAEVTIAAEDNWWGDPSGPYDSQGTQEADSPLCYDPTPMKNVDGLGDTASENVDYCPWMGEDTAIPTVSARGLLTMTLLLLVAGTVAFRHRRRPIPAVAATGPVAPRE